MKPEFSRVHKEGKRIPLQVLQPAAGDKENLVDGSRQSVTNMRLGVKLGDKGERNNTANEKVIEHSTVKRNLKKRKVANKLTQTDGEEDKNQINIRDLTSEGEPSSDGYWKLLAKRRRIELEECLQENKTLHMRLELMKAERVLDQSQLEECRILVEVLEEIVAGEDEARDD